MEPMRTSAAFFNYSSTSSGPSMNYHSELEAILYNGGKAPCLNDLESDEMMMMKKDGGHENILNDPLDDDANLEVLFSDDAAIEVLRAVLHDEEVEVVKSPELQDDDIDFEAIRVALADAEPPTLEGLVAERDATQSVHFPQPSLPPPPPPPPASNNVDRLQSLSRMELPEGLQFFGRPFQNVKESGNGIPTDPFQMMLDSFIVEPQPELPSFEAEGSAGKMAAAAEEKEGSTSKKAGMRQRKKREPLNLSWVPGDWGTSLSVRKRGKFAGFIDKEFKPPGTRIVFRSMASAKDYLQCLEKNPSLTVEEWVRQKNLAKNGVSCAYRRTKKGGSGAARKTTTRRENSVKNTQRLYCLQLFPRANLSKLDSGLRVVVERPNFCIGYGGSIPLKG